MNHPYCLGLVILLGGCAFDDGHGFATLRGGSLEGSFAPEPARKLDGKVLSDLGYVIELDELELDVHAVALEELGAGAGDSSFDPANPPPGYTVCHNGECHREDGAIVSWEEVEAELAGGDASFSPVATFEVERSLDFLGGPSIELGHASPSAELPMTTLRRAVVTAEGSTIRLTASGGNLQSEQRFAFEFEGPFRFVCGVDATIDRDGPETLTLTLEAFYTARLFDGVDLGGLEAGTITPGSTPLPASISAMSLKAILK